MSLFLLLSFSLFVSSFMPIGSLLDERIRDIIRSSMTTFCDCGKAQKGRRAVTDLIDSNEEEDGGQILFGEKEEDSRVRNTNLRIVNGYEPLFRFGQSESQSGRRWQFTLSHYTGLGWPTFRSGPARPSSPPTCPSAPGASSITDGSSQRHTATAQSQGDDKYG